MNRFLVLIGLCAALGFFLNLAQGRELYIWTDENGVKHYSNIAPSEATEEFQKKEEIESRGRPDSEPSTRTRQPQTRPFRTPPTSTQPDRPRQDPTRPPDPDAAQTGAATAPGLNLKAFPVPQGELVAREKAIVRNLQSELEDSDVDRDALIEAERRRLLEAIEDLEKAPLSKFGSQQNKQRQVGYYKYRLEAIEDDPETYFEYGHSDYD